MQSQNLIVKFLIPFLLLLPCEGSQKKDASNPTEKDALVTAKNSNNGNAYNDKNIQKTATPNPVLATNYSIVEAGADKKSKESTKDPHPLSSESTPKVARHLSSVPPKRIFLNGENGDKIILSKIQGPFFSNRMMIPERHLKILKKINRNKPEGMGEFVRYAAASAAAPRSMDMGGLGGLVNNFNDLYGNQAIMPSGTPNSLDHLYLPEFVAKDYLKPLDFNGINNVPNNGGQELSPAYADSFGYPTKPNNFKGNPIDINYHQQEMIGHGGFPVNPLFGQENPPVGPPQGPYHAAGPDLSAINSPQHQHQPHHHPEGPVGPHHNHRHLSDPHRQIHHHQQNDQSRRPPPPLPPNHNQPDREDDRSKRPRGKHHDNNPPHVHDDGPSETGSAEVQGDPGLWSILDLAHMLQNTGGLPTQLLDAAGSFSNQGSPSPDHHGHHHQRQPHGEDEDYDHRQQHFDGPRDHRRDPHNHHGDRDNYDRDHGHPNRDQPHENHRGNNNHEGFHNFGPGGPDEEDERGNYHESPPSNYESGYRNPGKFKPFHASSPRGDGGRNRRPQHFKSPQNKIEDYHREGGGSGRNGPRPQKPEGYGSDGHEGPNDEGPHSDDSYPPYNQDYDGSPNSEPGFDSPQRHQPNRNNFADTDIRYNEKGQRYNSPKNRNKFEFEHDSPSPNSNPNATNNDDDDNIGYFVSHEHFDSSERPMNSNPPNTGSKNIKNDPKHQESYGGFDTK